MRRDASVGNIEVTSDTPLETIETDVLVRPEQGVLLAPA